jgi:hypothetical protein
VIVEQGEKKKEPLLPKLRKLDQVRGLCNNPPYQAGDKS